MGILDMEYKNDVVQMQITHAQRAMQASRRVYFRIVGLICTSEGVLPISLS
jgi:hypothetical protein